MRIKLIKDSMNHQAGDILNVTISHPGYEGKLVVVDDNKNYFIINKLYYDMFIFIENKKKEVKPIP